MGYWRRVDSHPTRFYLWWSRLAESAMSLSSLRTSVRPCFVGMLTVTRQAAACDAISVYFGPRQLVTDEFGSWCRFGVAATALGVSAKLLYVEPG